MQTEEECVCNSCLNSIQKSNAERIEEEYYRKFISENIVSGFYPLFIFEKDKALQDIIHSIKYNKKFHNGIFLGKLLGESGKDIFRKWNIDLIIPVPLHRLKKYERGYNQSYYISKGMSKVTHIPVVQRNIKRIRFTETQTKMNLSQRKENINGAFKAKKINEFEGKTILLVDDVITTGATISECAKVLINSGAGKVYAASVAIAD